MKVIELRSDTKTLPTEEMRLAMYDAEVGDDVSREDPTVNRREELAAGMMGKESALFTPSGIMSNLIAVLTHTHPGEEIILGSEAHMFWYEVGGASALGGVVMRTVANEPDGRIELHKVEEAIRSEDIHFPPTTLLCLENTHNRCGGAVLTPEYTSAVAGIAHRKGLKVHLDGARIFSAAVALGVPAGELAEPADSVCFCLSKNLSAPVGSLLCGSREFVERARKRRRMVGGGMRQAGIIAAAGIVALEKMVDRLADDHANARKLAYGLDSIPGITIQPERFQTNIVVFEPPADIPVSEFIREMAERGVRVGGIGGRQVRAVTHRMVNADDIDEALKRIELLAKEIA
ncbi:MAG: low-specificity L-threonine aldolase [Dehalococcoidales bacterium]|nr:low-specificity L-threonine aldolase [Dehalococcoidales bacterium]